jgi:hypothetical protein
LCKQIADTPQEESIEILRKAAAEESKEEE